MARPVSLGWLLTLLVAVPAAAQFARPPVLPPRPPTPPAAPRMPILPPPVGVNRPPAAGPGVTTGQPVRYISSNTGRLAVIGGLYAAKRTTVPPPPLQESLPSQPAFDWPGMLAVTGGAGTPPDDAPRPWHFPDRAAAAPAPPANDTDWLPWVAGGGAAVAGLLGLVVVLRPRGGRVRVVAVPPGEAPAWVRQAWVGVELPTVRRQPRAVPTFQVLSGAHGQPGPGYEVPGPAAVAAVAVVNPDAADWWRANVPGVLDPRYTLVFPADVCERVG